MVTPDPNDIEELKKEIATMHQLYDDIRWMAQDIIKHQEKNYQLEQRRLDLEQQTAFLRVMQGMTEEEFLSIVELFRY